MHSYDDGEDRSMQTQTKQVLSPEKQTVFKQKMTLLHRFLYGSRFFFAISIASAAISALADMLGPQIIRIALDNVIGGKPASYAKPVMYIVS